MARRIQVLCDACAADDVETPGLTYTPNHGRRSIDLCEQHAASLVYVLESLLSERGIAEGQTARRAPRKASGSPSATLVPPGPQDAAERFPCLFCDQASPTSSAMGAHLARMHGSRISDAYGAQCPICGVQSAGTHIGRSHPEAAAAGMVGAFAWAQAHGDPHGVVARQLALAAGRQAS